jgi:hypothetical protein
MIRRLAAFVALGCAALPSAARAEVTGTTVARADALFTEAKGLRDAGAYAAACAKFGESARLAPGIGVTLYLADCYAELGRAASAWQSFRTAEKLATARGDARAKVAAARAKSLEHEVSRVIVTVTPSLRKSPVDVQFDGAPVLPETYAWGIAADPGDHQVTLRIAGRVARTVTAHVSAGGAATRVVFEEQRPVRVVPPPSATAADVPAAPTKVDPRRAAEIGLLGLGVVGIGVGAGFLAEKNASMTTGAPHGNPTYDSTAATVSTAGFAVAGAAFASAVVLYLTAPARKESASITLSPAPLPGGGGGVLRAQF